MTDEDKSLKGITDAVICCDLSLLNLVESLGRFNDALVVTQEGATVSALSQQDGVEGSLPNEQK